MFCLRSAKLVQPKPIKSFDLDEALDLLHHPKNENQGDVAHGDKTRITQVTKPGAFVDTRPPFRLHVVGGVVCAVDEVNSEVECGSLVGDSQKQEVVSGKPLEIIDDTVFANLPILPDMPPTPPATPPVEGNGYFGYECAGQLSSSTPYIPHYRMVPSAASARPLSAESQLAMFQTRVPDSFTPVQKAVNYDVQGWLEGMKKCEPATPGWAGVTSPSVVQLPTGSGLARIKQMQAAAKVEVALEDKDEDFVTATEGSISDDQSIMANTSVSSGRASVEGSSIPEHSSTSLFSTPSSSLLSIPTDCGNAFQENRQSIWNISMGVDPVSFLLNATCDLQSSVPEYEDCKLHWNVSMGGDAMSFLLNSGCV